MTIHQAGFHLALCVCVWERTILKEEVYHETERTRYTLWDRQEGQAGVHNVTEELYL